MTMMASQDYFRYEHDQIVGLICSGNCNTVYANKGKYVICGALESVYVWNVKTGERVQSWYDSANTFEATIITASPADENIFAVGYADGSLRIWNLKDASLSLVFNGHRGAMTSLSFCANGSKLASGAKDNDIVIWDLVMEAGLFRLSGHSSAVTGFAFYDESVLISVSKDTLMKVWDLGTQHCVETVVLHHAEISGIIKVDNNRLITVGADNKMRLFKVYPNRVSAILSTESPSPSPLVSSSPSSNPIKEDSTIMTITELVESINRSSNERASSIVVDDKNRYIAVASVDRSIELWKLSHDEGKVVEKEENEEKISSTPTSTANVASKKIVSNFKRLCFTKLMMSKFKSIAFTPGWKIKSTESVKLMIQSNDNQLGEFCLPLDRTKEGNWTMKLDLLGHRSECKAIAISKDGTIFASAGKDKVKVWNSGNGALLLTIPCEQEPSAILFFNEDKSVLIGTAGGDILYVDLISGDVIDSVVAHKGLIRSMTLRPDGKGMMTGGADKNVKFWEFKLAKKSLKMIKTLQMNDEIVHLCYSPDLRYIAVATMDMNIRVFFEDSLSFYLSLYGHKLPITAFDISTDGKVLISASADKNVKFWSLEFGECKRSIFAHSDVITAIAFIPGTKLFVTASKDKTLKYWDCEKYLELQKLSGHQAEIWCMALNNNCIITGSKDKSIRIWRQGEEMLFPEEEREKELEEQFEKSMIEENPYEREGDSKVEESGKATTSTIATMKAGERIMEHIEAADDERRNWDEYHLAKANGLSAEEPIMGAFYLALGKNKTPAEFVLAAFEKIPLADINEALLCLPTSVLPSLLLYIKIWLESRRNIIMSARIMDMVLSLFHSTIMANPGLRMTLEAIRDLERTTLTQIKDIIGYNNVAIDYS